MRHVDVGQDQIRVVMAREFKCLEAVGGLHDLIPSATRVNFIMRRIDGESSTVSINLAITCLARGH